MDYNEPLHYKSPMKRNESMISTIHLQKMKCSSRSSSRVSTWTICSSNWIKLAPQVEGIENFPHNGWVATSQPNMGKTNIHRPLEIWWCLEEYILSFQDPLLTFQGLRLKPTHPASHHPTTETPIFINGSVASIQLNPPEMDMKSVNVEDLIAVRTSSFQPFGNGAGNKKIRKTPGLVASFWKNRFRPKMVIFFSVEITVMDSSWDFFFWWLICARKGKVVAYIFQYNRCKYHKLTIFHISEKISLVHTTQYPQGPLT